MKTYSYNIVIVALFIMFACTVNAQNSADYKHPYSLRTQTAISPSFKINSPEYISSDNYKHPLYTVRAAVTKVEIPACCSKVRGISINYPNYKHPYPKFDRKICSLGFVCNRKVQLACCL
jgi:hypothetical protein